MSKNNLNRKRPIKEIIQIDDADNESTSHSYSNIPENSEDSNGSDIEVIEDIKQYVYEQKVKEKRKEILNTVKNNFTKESGVYFEHYLGCIDTDAIILSYHLKEVKDHSNSQFFCEVNPKSTVRYYAPMYTIIVNDHYVPCNDYVRVRSKLGIKGPNQIHVRKRKTKRRRTKGVADDAMCPDSVDPEYLKRHISADRKYEEYYKTQNEILRDIFVGGGNACIRMKHNMTDIFKLKNDLSKALSVLLILNVIRIEIEYENISDKDFRMSGNLKTYVHVILLPDAFKIDLQKFEEGSQSLIKNSIMKLFDELKLNPVREAKIDLSKTLTVSNQQHNKMDISFNRGTSITKAASKPTTVEKYRKSVSFSSLSADSFSSFASFVSPRASDTTPFVPSVSSFSGLQTPHHALDCEGSQNMSDSLMNIMDDIDIVDSSSDTENVETIARAEMITNCVFYEERYRGGLLVEDFKEVHLDPKYFISKLKPYQAEGVWWMYLKENPPEYNLQKSDTEASSVKLERENKNVSLVQIKSETVESGTSDNTIKTEIPTSFVEKKKERNEIRNKPLNPVWAEYIFEPALHIFESNRLKWVLKYFYVNKLNGVMSLCFPEYTPPFRGGILSDDMGLGKTVQSIGLIVHDILENNLHLKPNKEDCRIDDAYFIEKTIQGRGMLKGGTLIIAPLSLLYQWKEEIIRHTSKGFISVYVYYSENKYISSEELSKYNVVLTTYSTAAAEYANCFVNKKRKKSFKSNDKKKSYKEGDNANASDLSGQMKMNNFFMKTKLANVSSVGGNEALGFSPIVKKDPYDVKNEEGDNSMVYGSANETGINKSNTSNNGSSERRPNSSLNNQEELKEPCLFKITWRRIFMDEAHVIKNKNSLQSLAAWKLKGERRWCITGTPVQNTIDDVFPLLRFIGVKPYGNYEWWIKEVIENMKTKEKYSKVINLIRKITSPILLRRTKTSKGKDGNTIITLPPKSVHIVKLKFTEEEKDFYQAVYYKSKTKFDMYLNDGTIMNHYTHVLHLLLNLRQCCSHPMLLFSKPFFEEWNSNDALTAQENVLGEEAKNLSGLKQVAEKENSPIKISVPTERFTSPKVKQESDRLRNSIDSTQNHILLRLLQNSNVSHKLDDNCLKEIENLKNDSFNVECIICTEDAVDPLITKCMHIMCTKCARTYFHLTEVSEKPCPLCGHYINLKSLKTLQKNVCPIKDLLQKMTKENFIYSTKLKKLFEFVQQDMKEEKHVVVFSQWVGFLKIISTLFMLYNIPHKIYDGSIKCKDRKQVLFWFNIQRGNIYQPGVGFVKAKEDIPHENFAGKVLLCSLKAGGVGLNLTVASKLYLMDMWWNPAIEDQAFQRVHRIGQLKKVEIYKFVIERTIETKILELHDKKNITANEIMTQQGNAMESVQYIVPEKLSMERLIDMFKECDGDESN